MKIFVPSLKKTAMTKKVPCIQCKANITDIRKPGIGCDTVGCNNVIHVACAKLAKETFNDIASGKAAWTCRICKQKHKSRRSSIFPAAAVNSPSQTSQPSTSVQASESQLQSLIIAFNEYKTVTDQRIQQLEAICEAKSQQLASLTSSVEGVEEKAELIARETAESSLEIQGIPESDLVNPVSAALAVAADIGCDLSPDEFECDLSRAGVKPTVVIKFASRSRRRFFLHAGKKFNRDRRRIHRNDADYKIFVNERLTAVQKKLLYNTKCFARDADYKFAWFCNGLVHLKKSDRSRLIIVKAQSQLEELIRHEAPLLLPERQGTANEDGPTDSVGSE